MAEYGDKQALTSEKANGDSQLSDECETVVEEASTSSDSNHNKKNDSGWNKVHTHIQQLSNTIIKSIPSKLHSRISSEEDYSNDNSTSSGFSSAQHSPEEPSNLTAYENFLIVDDNFDDEIRASPSLLERRRTSYERSVPNRCIGVLKLNEETAPDTRQQPNISTDSHSAVDNNSDRAQSNTNSSRASCSFWDRMRVITNAITLRQPPFQPFTPSPSGSLLPNQSPPNATSIVALRKQQIQNLKNQSRQRKQQQQQQARSYDDWNAHRKRTIKRYVYISQGALIIIIALVWLASNFVDLRKSPNSLLHPLSNDSTADAHSNISVTNVTASNNYQQLHPQLSMSIHKSDSGNTKLTQHKLTNTDYLYSGHKKKAAQNGKTLELANTRDDHSDKHKIRKRWKNFLRSQRSL
ncbi:unnamed protein product [Anisakis simplex]|uniref:Serine/threonine-protein kinase DDB_G0282963 n=1 Tax=Anisakis simplex TaxID=6269 RepID=A0A0M3K4Q2_ANISI|nr:unnamed protein product [Anisakis simplex]